MARPPRYQAQEPFLIYQDNFFSQAPSMISHAPMPPAPKPARQPLQSANSNVVLDPPTATFVKQSPYKANAPPSDSSHAPTKPSQGNKLKNAVQITPPSNPEQSTDSLEKKQPVMSRFKTVAQKPQPELNIQFMGKENSHAPIYPAPTQSQFNLPLENYYQKPSGKRLLEAAPIKELRPAKQPRLDEPLPPHDSFPPIEDDGKKPGHSYATLIGMAILRSPQRRLTLAQIYKWISDTYSFYNANDAGWQNSIRHNLSLNKHFIKQERPKDDPGKGNYWAIEPGAEHLFMREKPSRKSAASAENIPVMSTRLEPSQPQPQVPFIHEPMLPPQHAAPQSSLPALPPSSQQLAPAPPLPEISSDATIPASDMATVDEGLERPTESELLNEPELYSPLPAAMHSSPPIPRHIDARHSGTPPSQPRLHASSASKSRSHRRRFMSMDDSGYISSLESSAMRPNHTAKLLTSEADRPRIKRGRAEEEIARLRASSYDSPSKGRSYGYPPPSSSPLRQTSHNGSGQMLPPLTPAMKLKAPPKPPPSVSPSTNLRLHRENIQSLVDSPFRRVTALLPESETVLQHTPGFDIDQLLYEFERKPDDNTGFDIFEDQPPFSSVFALTPGVTSNGSPAKRSSRKQRLERSQSTSVLNETTASSNNASNFLKVPSQTSNLLLDTPSKVFEGLPSSPSKLFLDLQSPSKMPLANNENLEPWPCFEGLEAADFLEENDFSGFDMLAGFQKIGSSNGQTASRAPKTSQKAPLGRSYTSTF
ncbi:Forkhead protein sep1 [Madurella mycetomatis]|uniref:Forkhead protein sep1 n=1 Tax=Madurella mycetomatis TaxID=100816 RepID=A0A175VNE6_9PEZI|nr:Forkhead protein sep1 [Madurella mycetomatis]